MFGSSMDTLLIFIVTIPLVGRFTQNVKLAKYRDRACGVYALLGLLLSAYFIFDLYKAVVSRSVVVITFLQNPPPPLGACFEIDMLGVFMASLIIGLGIGACLYSISYMEHDTGLVLYYVLLLGQLAGMVGVVFAGDLFTLFIFWELMCLTSYCLVAYRKKRWAPVEAGFKFLIMSSFGNVTVLFAMSLLYGMTGTLNMAFLASSLQHAKNSVWISLAMVMAVVGFGVEAALVPLHFWLPDAHPEAPSPISALLSGVVIKTGAYALLRTLFLVFSSGQVSWQLMLAVVAVITMTVGNLMALLQEDFKRLLAYSSVAHMGYVVFGLTTAYGVTASLFHVMNHAIMKGLLFLCAGCYVHMVGTRDIEELSGVWRRMPVTTIVCTIGLFAIAGMPPLNGFLSEFMLVMAGIRAGTEAARSYMNVLSAIMLVNMLFSVAYYLRLVQVFVLKKESQTVISRAREAPASMLLPICVLALLSILIGVYPYPFLSFVEKAANAVSQTTTYISAIVG